MTNPYTPFSRWIAALVLAGASLGAQAHGDEPHGDAPHPVAAAGSLAPRFESATEAFELVGRLEAGALTLFIQRFDTSEPVAQAKLELESGELKAVAAYQSAQGSYVVSEPRFLEALSRPGSHSVLITVLAGPDSDLLQATLDVQAPAVQAPSPWPRSSVLWGGAAALGLLGLALLALRRRRVRKLGAFQ